MTDDMWWAFVAGIDRAALIQELPGGASDRKMRADHAERVAALRGVRVAPPVISAAAERRDDALLGPGRLAEAERESRGWTVRAAEARQRQIAAYAARKRGHAA